MFPARRLACRRDRLLGGGCAEGGDEPSPASTRDTSGTSDAADVIARSSEQIDIGVRSLHLQCWGERVAGEPSVLLISDHAPGDSRIGKN